MEIPKENPRSPASNARSWPEINIKNDVNPTFINASVVVITDTNINRARRERSHTWDRNFLSTKPRATVKPPDTAKNVAKAIRSLAGGCSVISVNRTTDPMAAETTPSPIAVQIPEPDNLSEVIPKPSMTVEVLNLKFVPHSPDSLDVSWLHGIGFEFLSQPSDMDGDGGDVSSVGKIPHLVHKLFSGEYPAGIGSEEKQQVKFLSSKRDRTTVRYHRPTLRVDCATVETQDTPHG